MRTPVTALGDAHNFGRRVSRRGKRVLKPRTLFWEWLLLGTDSPLRQRLEQLAERDGLGHDAFGFLPRLSFFRGRSGVGGEVQALELEPLPRASRARRRELAVIVGRSLALWTFFGVADLHWENLVLGVDARGRIVFGPLDIELMLAELSLPTETKLLPDADPEYRELCRHAAGVRRALPVLGKPIDAGDLLAMLSAYHRVVGLLERHARQLGQLLASLPELRQAPIRVLLRSTGEYLGEDHQALWPPLLEAEAEQLARGDVPYFFRLYGRRGIHYYKSRDLETFETLPLKGDVPQLDKLLDLSRGLSVKSRPKLGKDGLFCLLGAFDSPELRGRHAGDGVAVAFGARRLTVELEGGPELETGRDLSEFVSSVYLPCRCGEVRSVFVPARSRCTLR
jgi:hypothetical protein